MKSINDFKKAKQNLNKISMVTCYDAWSASIIEKSNIDCVLVGDSLAMVVYGHDSTLHADIKMMFSHTAAVRRKSTKFIIADMPFLSTRKGIKNAMNAVQELMKAGANAVKIEGIDGQEDVIKAIIQAGVPVMGHIGLTPQSIHQMGGYKIQGKTDKDSQKIKDDALKLQALGCFSLVMECVPTQLGAEVSELLNIPTIGIGAGPFCDGQVLVLQDLLGAQSEINPRFVRRYQDVSESWSQTLNKFDKDIKAVEFPNKDESYLWQ